MNKRLINLQDISCARNFIYGLSILWIVFYHCGLNVTNYVLQTVKSYGDCAVEIFFFMSGCCLYFSYVKKPSPLEFYKKRLLRTLPYYLIFYGVVFVYFNLIKTPNVGQFFLNYTMLDYWLHGLGNSPWFLAAILVFYALYPLIYKVFFGNHKRKWIYVAVFLSVLTAASVTLSVYFTHLRIFLYRIPIFLLGCVAGKFVYEGREFKFYHGLILFACLIVGKVLFVQFKDVSVLRNLYYLPLSLTVTLIFSQVYKFNSIFCSVVNKPIEYVGTFSLEIYLTHEKVQENVIRILNGWNIEVSFNNTWYQLSCIALAIGISIGLALLIRLVINACKKRLDA